MPPPPTPAIKKGDAVTFGASLGDAGSHKVYPGVVVRVPDDKHPYWVISTNSALMYLSVHITVSKPL